MGNLRVKRDSPYLSKNNDVNKTTIPRAVVFWCIWGRYTTNCYPNAQNVCATNSGTLTLPYCPGFPGCSYTYPPLSIGSYSFIQLSKLEQCGVKKLAQGFNTAARIRTRVLVVESPKLYPWATALTQDTPVLGPPVSEINYRSNA